MNKVFVYAGVGVIAYMGYRLFVAPQMGRLSTSPYSAPQGGFVNGQLLGQPSQSYPFKAVVPPRVDNSNQPWYGGSRAAAQGPTQSPQPPQISQDAMTLKAGSEILTSLHNIWSDLGVGDWFTSNDNSVEELSDASDWF